MPLDRHERTRKAYQVLRERDGQLVTDQEIAAHVGWEQATVRSYRGKNWHACFRRQSAGIYRVSSISQITEDDFVGVHRQVRPSQADPLMAIAQRALADGEGQRIEFKEDLTGNASDLCKEIVAFATSNDGVIVIGVNDDGEICGYGDQRERVEPLVTSVRPLPSADVDLITMQGHPICMVRVSKGAGPVYLYNERPYVRQGSLSRPATPDEVRDLHRIYFRSGTLGASLQRGRAEFGTNSDVAEVGISAVDPMTAEFGFSPSGDVAGELTSPTSLRFTRIPGSRTPFVIIWVRMR